MTIELKNLIVAEIDSNAILTDDYRDINFKPLGIDGVEVAFNILTMPHFQALSNICQSHDCTYFLKSIYRSNNLNHQIRIHKNAL